MGRRQAPLTDGSPYAALAAPLRELRGSAELTLRALAARSGYSAGSLAGAEGGRVLPSWPLTEAFVQACGEEPAHWRKLWQATADRAAATGVPASQDRSGMRGAAAGLPTQPAELPPDVPDFTGRGEELGYALGAVATAGGAAFLTVCGQPGAGKTCFAVHLGHVLRTRFPDGQLMIDLLGSGEQPRPAGEALRMLLESLGVPAVQVPAGLERRRSLYRSLVAERSLFLLIDNARDERQVRPLLPGGDRCLTVVTCRSLLPGLEASGSVVLAELTNECSLELLGRIAGHDRIAAERSSALAVVRSCGRLPLALRIAGARLASRPAWTLAHLAKRLSRERDLLDELAAGDLAVRRALELSYRMLPPAHRHVFRHLALLPGPDFTAESAAVVSGATTARAGRALECLADGNLVAATAGHRFRFHDLVRAYAAERVRKDEDSAALVAARTRVLTWYLHTAAAADRLLIPARHRICPGPPGPGLPPPSFTLRPGALRWCDAESANLVAAVPEAARHGLHDVAWQLAANLRCFAEIRGLWAEWAATHRVGIRSARRTGQHAGEAWLLNSLGTLHHRMLRLDRAISCHAQAAAVYGAITDKLGEGSALNNLGCLYGDVGRYDDAVACLREAAAIRRATGDRTGEGVTLGNLGDTYCQMGCYDTAVRCLRRALRIHRQAASPYNEALSLHSLGEAYRHMGGNAERALASLRQALAIFRRLDHPYGEAMTLESLGDTWQLLGELPEAAAHWDLAIAVFAAIGHPRAAQLRQRVAASGTPEQASQQG